MRKSIKFIAWVGLVLLLISVAYVLIRSKANIFFALSATPTEEIAASQNENQMQVSNLVAQLPPFKSNNSLQTTSLYRQVLLNTNIPNRPSVEVTTYEVQKGDNLFTIAEKFGLKPETVLWSNYEVLKDNPQFLRPGQILNILPTDGVYYQWSANDDLSAVANFFRVDPDDILEWSGNQIDLTTVNNLDLADGTWLVIPGGRRALKDWGPPAITRKNPASARYYGSGYCGQVYEGAVGIGAFIWPTVSRLISGYDYNPSIHPGLDIAGSEGNAVYATDSGVVVYAGWSEYGYGYLIVLDHGNGWQSAYAHLSAVGVRCGQSVAQGTMIGAVGNTGNSSGAHLHFELRSEVYGKANPWNFVSQ